MSASMTGYELLIRTGHKRVATVTLFDWGAESLMVTEAEQRRLAKNSPVSATHA